MPELRNADGDEILFTTITFPLAKGVAPDAVRAALAKLPELRPASATFWNWLETEGRAGDMRLKNPLPSGESISTYMDDGSLVLGNVELNRRDVTLSVNSAARKERGLALLAPALSGLVGDHRIASKTLEQLQASGPKQQKAKPSGLSAQLEREAAKETLDRYYESVLGDKVPMLGDMTPLQAAKTVPGREKLAVWLKYLENQTSKQESNLANYDFGWLWERLGVSALRR
jgi:hypothetical protein